MAWCQKTSPIFQGPMGHRTKLLNTSNEIFRYAWFFCRATFSRKCWEHVKHGESLVNIKRKKRFCMKKLLQFWFLRIVDFLLESPPSYVHFRREKGSHRPPMDSRICAKIMDIRLNFPLAAGREPDLKKWRIANKDDSGVSVLGFYYARHFRRST